MDAVRTFDDLHVSAGDADALGVTPRLGVRAPPSAASPLFATPSSAMSATDLCRGSIRGSGGSRFCCKPFNACTAKYHKTQKVNVLPLHLYLQAPRMDQALLEPALDASNLPRDIKVEELLEMQRPSDVFVMYFEALLAQGRSAVSRGLGLDDEVDDVPMSEDSWIPVAESPSGLRDIDKARRTLQSPKKLKGGELLAELASSAPVGVPKLASMSLLKADQMENILGDPTTVTTVVNEWNQLILAKTVLDIQGNVNGTEVKIQLLLARMGHDPDPLEGGSVTLWDAIRTLRVTTEEMQKDIVEALQEVRLAGRKSSSLSIRVAY
eukprot:scaffold27684_cov62-Attheya_sp.AAC.1